MIERPRNTDSIESALESLSPRELRRYITLWVDGTFERFFQEARLCQDIALRQIEAAKDGPEIELMEWVKTLEVIDTSIDYAEQLQIALAFGWAPPESPSVLVSR